MADFTWIPGISTKLDRKPRLISAQYSGGYQQNLADGPNNCLGMWSLSFADRDWEMQEAIDAFLISKGGYIPFSWNPLEPVGDPADPSKEIMVVCKQWGTSWDDGGQTIGMTAIFEEVKV